MLRDWIIDSCINPHCIWGNNLNSLFCEMVFECQYSKASPLLYKTFTGRHTKREKSPAQWKSSSWLRGSLAAWSLFLNHTVYIYIYFKGDTQMPSFFCKKLLNSAV